MGCTFFRKKQCGVILHNKYCRNVIFPRCMTNWTQKWRLIWSIPHPRLPKKTLQKIVDAWHVFLCALVPDRIVDGDASRRAERQHLFYQLDCCRGWLRKPQVEIPLIYQSALRSNLVSAAPAHPLHLQTNQGRKRSQKLARGRCFLCFCARCGINSHMFERADKESRRENSCLLCIFVNIFLGKLSHSNGPTFSSFW